MVVHARVLGVVQPGAAQLSIVELEAERMNKVQFRTGVRTQADDIARVRRDAGLVQYDVWQWHGECPDVAAKPEQYA